MKLTEEETLLQAEFDEEKAPVKLKHYVADMEEICELLDKIEDRLSRIERFLQKKFLEEWDSHV